jgi:hypothetical protein
MLFCAVSKTSNRSGYCHSRRLIVEKDLALNLEIIHLFLLVLATKKMVPDILDRYKKVYKPVQNAILMNFMQLCNRTTPQECHPAHFSAASHSYDVILC